MKINLILIFICLTLQIPVNAQLNLIPTPKKIIENTSSYNINLPYKIINTNKSNHQNILPNIFNTTQGKSAKVNTIKINLLPTYQDFLKQLKKENLQTDILNNKEGYVLQIKEKEIQIFAFDDSGVFYATQTLNQLVNQFKETNKIPCLTIYDWPDIAIRAWQDDISRGPIPSMEMLKKEIRILASYKLNYFTLYIEHVFKLDKHPTIAPKDGITKQELKELIKYAENYHIKLIGSYQSFGHLKKTLSNPRYAHLAENDHIISPALKESYEFLDDVYSEIVPSFSGEYFNINCDETFGLGEGKSKTMVDTMGVPGVYAYHINKLNNLLKKYDKKILMWGDIAANHPEITKKLPKDITVIPWAYHAAESFDYAIEPISKQGLNFWVAPGVSCWSNIYPDMDKAKTNIYNFIRDGYKLGATGVLNTSWDDDGLNFFNTTWHGFIWGSEISWNAPKNLPKEASNIEKEKRYTKFNQSFDIQFYGLKGDNDMSVVQISKELSDLHEKGIYHNLKNERFFEPIFPIHLDYVKKGQREQNTSIELKTSLLLEKLASIATDVKRNKFTIPYLSFAIKQVKFLSKKNIFRINLYQYLQGDSTISIKDLKEQRDSLIATLKVLKQEYIELWNNENRKHWLDVNTKKFDELIMNLTNVGDKVLIEPAILITKKGRKITLQSVFNDHPIKYTLNGDTISSTSKTYIKPIFVKGNIDIKAATFKDNKIGSVSEKKLIQHKAIGRLYRLNTEYSDYHPSYDGGGKYALVDGVLGDADNIRSRKWQAYSGKDIDIELSFSGKQKLNTFSMGFFQNTMSWVVFPKQVDIYIKNNDTDEYTLFKSIKGNIKPEKKGALKEKYQTNLEGISPKFMRIVAKNYGDLPDWHPAGPGNASMLFADEIIIE